MISRYPTANNTYNTWAAETGQTASNPALGIRQAKSQKLAPKLLDRKQRRDLVSTLP